MSYNNNSGGRRHNNKGRRGGGKNRKNGFSNSSGGFNGNSGGFNNNTNTDNDPNVKEILTNNNIFELNRTKNNQHDKILVEDAELINGVLIFQVKNRDFCLVYDTNTKSFQNKQFYLHPEVRGSYKLYKGRMPNIDQDLLLVTHAFKNVLINQKIAFLVFKPKLDFKNFSTDIEIPVSMINAIDLVYMDKGLMITTVWDNKKTLFIKVYGLSKVDFTKGVEDIKKQLEEASKEIKVDTPIGCCDVMGTMLLGGIRLGNGILAIDMASGNVNKINQLHNPKHEVVGIKCITLVNNGSKAEFIVSVDNSGLVVLWNQQMNKITFNLNAPVFFFDIAQVQEGKYIAIFGDYRGIVHIVAIFGEIKKMGEIKRFFNPKFRQVRKGSKGIFSKVFLRINGGVPYVFMVTNRAEVSVCAYNIAGN